MQRAQGREFFYQHGDTLPDGWKSAFNEEVIHVNDAAARIGVRLLGLGKVHKAIDGLFVAVDSPENRHANGTPILVHRFNLTAEN